MSSLKYNKYQKAMYSFIYYMLTRDDVINIYDKENMDLIEEIKAISIDTIESNIHNNYADYVKIRNEIREKIGAYLYKETGSKPVILTVIQEIEV